MKANRESGVISPFILNSAVDGGQFKKGIGIR
jgi:hypothetical protein